MILPILYEDSRLLVINKPTGLLVHKSKASSVLETTVVDILATERSQRLHPVHRLDRATSGVLLLAKDPGAAAFYGKLFEERKVEKAYVAVVRGFLDSQEIDYPLKHLEREGLVQEARTRLKLIRTTSLPYPSGPHSESRYSLVELYPETGRRHQLRRHMKHLHHPIVGDTVYGHGVHNRIFRTELDCHRLLLHHLRLTLKIEDSPNGASFDFVAPYDTAWTRVLGQFT